MGKEPFNIKRLFFLAKTQLNYSRQDFFDATFKEIVDMLEELRNMHSADNNNSVEQVVSIEDIPFL